jgi:hypothetical protein
MHLFLVLFQLNILDHFLGRELLLRPIRRRWRGLRIILGTYRRLRQLLDHFLYLSNIESILLLILIFLDLTAHIPKIVHVNFLL